MPQKRSRPLTEQKFQNAVLQLIAQQGCSGIGVNNVAQIAGADKVLIYRYFGNIDSLLQRVAESRDWLPDIQELLGALGEDDNGAAALRSISNHLWWSFSRGHNSIAAVNLAQSTSGPAHQTFFSAVGSTLARAL